MSEAASDARDRAIADFFKVLTDLARECVPLVKVAVNEQLKKEKIKR